MKTRCNFGYAEDFYAPARPVDAVTCDECEGRGWILGTIGASPELIRGACDKCDGVGWYIPDDEPVN